jgi:hypothetical protein
MSLVNKTPFFLVLTALSFAQGPMCSGVVERETQEMAKNAALEGLAVNINAKIEVSSEKNETSVGVGVSTSGSTNKKMSYKLRSTAGVKFNPQKTKAGYSDEACISVEDATKPYLDSLLKLKDLLAKQAQKSNAATCNAIDTTYYKILEEEAVLEPLVKIKPQDKYLLYKKEYEAAYKKAKEVCKQQVSTGIYIESDNEDFTNRITQFFQDFGCSIAETALSANMTLSLNDIKAGEGCELTADRRDYVHCYACVNKINLQDGKTGKSLYKDPFKGSKETHADKEIACKEALEKAPKELWNKMKGKIKKENCK